MIWPHVYIINFKHDCCACMCMRHLLLFEFNNDGMLEKRCCVAQHEKEEITNGSRCCSVAGDDAIFSFSPTQCRYVHSYEPVVDCWLHGFFHSCTLHRNMTKSVWPQKSWKASVPPSILASSWTFHLRYASLAWTLQIWWCTVASSVTSHSSCETSIMYIMCVISPCV